MSKLVFSVDLWMPGASLNQGPWRPSPLVAGFLGNGTKLFLYGEARRWCYRGASADGRTYWKCLISYGGLQVTSICKYKSVKVLPRARAPFTAQH